MPQLLLAVTEYILFVTGNGKNGGDSVQGEIPVLILSVNVSEVLNKDNNVRRYCVRTKEVKIATRIEPNNMGNFALQLVTNHTSLQV